MKKTIFFLLSFCIGLSANAFAESITLTTYYPAPFGMYQEMRVMGQLGVGTTDPQAKVEIVPDAGQGAIVAGSGNTATNISSAFGLNNTVSGLRSFASGSSNTVSGSTASAFGLNNSVTGSYSFASGNANVVSGQRASVFGQASTASGDYSFAVGEFVHARAKNSAVFGKYNIVSGTTDAWVDTDPLFVIGNGTSSANRSNAVTVLKNGRVGIGTNNPNGKLHVVQDDLGVYTAGFEMNASGVGKYGVAVFKELPGLPQTPPTEGGIYIRNDGAGYGIYQATDNDNYFAGDVGIGKAVPESHLHVNAQGSAEALWIKSDAADSSAGLSLVSGGLNDRYSIYSSRGTLKFMRYRNGAGQIDSNFVTIDDQGWPNGGYVGIGITAPKAKLDVNGAVKIGSDTMACSADTAGALKFTPIEKVVCATGTVQTSTLRLCSTDDNGANWKWYLVHGDWNEVCSPSPSPIE